MNENLKKLYLILTPNNAFIFISFAFIIQLFYLISFKSFDCPQTNDLFFLKGDGFQYVNYCENLYNYHTFFEGTKNSINSYTSRMPGMCVLYIPLRCFFNQNITLNVFVIIQVLLSSIASYLLALSALKIIKSNFAFYLTFLLYGTGMYCANYNHRLYTESLALSTIIFSLYFLISYLETKKPKYIFLFTLFIIWCSFLRPFIAPMIGFAFLYFFYLLLKKRININAFALFVIPVFVVFGSWTYRNYRITQLVIPLQSGDDWYNGDIVTESRTHFIKTFGLGWIWWNKNSEHTWFMNDDFIVKFKIQRPSDSIFFKNRLSRQIFTKGLTIDSLKQARYDSWQSQNAQIPASKRDSFAQASASRLNRFILYQKESHPFDYYISYRLRVFKNLLYQIHGASITSFKYPFNVIFMISDAIVNYFVFLFGTFSLVLIAARKEIFKIKYISISIIPLFILIYFSFILRIDESRFIVMTFPFLVLCGVKGLDIISGFKYKNILFFLLAFALFAGGINSAIHDIKW